MKKIDRNTIIHEFLVAKLQYDFSQHQFQSNITCHNLVNILIFEVFKIHISMFIMSFQLWKKNESKRMIGRISFMNFR